MLYTAGMCDVTFTEIAYLHGICFLFRLYNEVSCVTPQQTTGFFVPLDSQVHACWCYSKQFSVLTPTSNLLQKYSLLRVCFFDEHMRQRFCLPLLGQWCECFTSYQLSWDANRIGLPPWPATSCHIFFVRMDNQFANENLPDIFVDHLVATWLHSFISIQPLGRF